MDRGYERGYNCFSHSNAVMEFLVLVVDIFQSPCCCIVAHLQLSFSLWLNKPLFCSLLLLSYQSGDKKCVEKEVCSDSLDREWIPPSQPLLFLVITLLFLGGGTCDCCYSFLTVVSCVYFLTLRNFPVPPACESSYGFLSVVSFVYRLTMNFPLPPGGGNHSPSGTHWVLQATACSPLASAFPVSGIISTCHKCAVTG